MKNFKKNNHQAPWPDAYRKKKTNQRFAISECIYLMREVIHSLVGKLSLNKSIMKERNRVIWSVFGMYKLKNP